MDKDKKISSIYLWNANSIKNKIEELKLFLESNNVDFFALNETKRKWREIFEETNYNYACNSRLRGNGGGVAVLIKKEISFEQIHDLDHYMVEQLCIKIKTEKKQDFYLINFYNPPNQIININMLEFIDKNYKNYVICGDLNSKSRALSIPFIQKKLA
jgi:exonuclease III